MSRCSDQAALDQWYPLDTETEIPFGTSSSRLLGSDLVVTRETDGSIAVTAEEGALQIIKRFGLVWTTLGQPAGGLFALPEADEEDRRVVNCGSVMVRASGLRIVENFLDMAHFPFVHTDILGAEPHTEVMHYNAEIRRDVDEVWATNCQFFQPQAALSATGGIMTDYIYRVMTPFATLLYKTCPNAANRWDVICLFVQPLDPGRCRAHPVMFLIDDVSTTTELVHFQQLIFLQDRIILENQRPVLLPMEARSEIPTRADASSIAYRRWLKEKGITYGTSAMAA
ncbi:aromatic ring-hydroxylating dioxygenase subunit alpha [Rhizobium sp. VS19-DR104.2]|uniref:aromatic ring-hydroxylating oxygenase subunit alpha n=1 Tax=unclassified Rhizobium TaxID=2613769 RepID=UPI001C5A7E02|nr:MULTISPECIES: aromatic ring-hydroxylating dioxygenase subunit alpha [unclassified Rhizobium]MBZ5761865.1 aromatic ring-hydroxylating dioxygenase subunit alpha [Rhizobium sp. VS19-DR96]MBZ5767941.1 aromatic ring-hydroxylating dioxygenase subunit alpha [Rhizobium sp. VS19-DR129.2]MBZ5775289.1 aromatic ring-hydroxylating dioxygenase subunit alpha [Rhizobium sp. VS19-DRK62.2]MBZ5786744.1 aromatic ring-hydroxylating dioxygenase subunit alpha [Rhizobium sp. VS19-DR121]MBZ5803900.1 aromatic ring-h